MTNLQIWKKEIFVLEKLFKLNFQNPVPPIDFICTIIHDWENFLD